jgi:hypothetical protein
MYGLVAVHAFAHQTCEGPPDRSFVAERGLILYDSVSGCVQLQVGKADARLAMIGFGQRDALRFTERKPFGGRRLLQGIVAVHLEAHPCSFTTNNLASGRRLTQELRIRGFTEEAYVRKATCVHFLVRMATAASKSGR